MHISGMEYRMLHAFYAATANCNSAMKMLACNPIQTILEMATNERKQQQLFAITLFRLLLSLAQGLLSDKGKIKKNFRCMFACNCKELFCSLATSLLSVFGEVRQRKAKNLMNMQAGKSHMNAIFSGAILNKIQTNSLGLSNAKILVIKQIAINCAELKLKLFCDFNKKFLKICHKLLLIMKMQCI